MVSISFLRRTSLIEFLHKKSFSTTTCLKAGDETSNTPNEAQPDSSNRDHSQQESTNQPADGQPDPSRENSQQESSNNQPADGQPESTDTGSQQTSNQQTDVNSAEDQRAHLQSLVDEFNAFREARLKNIKEQDKAIDALAVDPDVEPDGSLASHFCRWLNT